VGAGASIGGATPKGTPFSGSIGRLDLFDVIDGAGGAAWDQIVVYR